MSPKRLSGRCVARLQRGVCVLDRGGRAAIGIALALGGCNWLKSKQPDGATATNVTTAQRLAIQRRLQHTCASNATYDRLKVAMFEKAARIRGGRTDALDQLEAATFVRMESPLVKSRDEALNSTVCTGRFVLELPEGAVRVFNGERRLTADIEYSAQQAVDNSGLVYRMQGDEPIVYRLSAIDMGVRGARPIPPPVVQPAVAPQIAKAEPAPPTPPPPPPPPPPPSPPPPSPPPRPRVVPPPAPPRASPPPNVRVRVAETPPSIDARPSQDAPVRVARARPSYDCRRATGRVTTMICSDDRLAAADRRMSAAYFRELAAADPGTKAALIDSARGFLAFRNRCPNDACVAQAYADRMDEIRDIAEGR